MKLSELREAKAKAKGGGWARGIQIGDTGITIDIRARRLGNNDADRVRYEYAAEQVKDGAGKDDLPARRAALAHVIAHAVLVDWSLTDEEGVHLPCTPETALELFADETLGEDLLNAVVVAAADVERRGAEAYEADAKN